MHFCARPGKRAFTLVEIAVGVALFMFVMAGFIALNYGQSKQTERVGQKADLADEARSAYFRMTEEIKVGIDLLHPLVGSQPTPYLLFTNDRYELIAYWVEKYKVKSDRGEVEMRKLVRLNFNDPAGRKPEIVAPYVDRVQFNRTGPRLVEVTMSLKDADQNVIVLTSSVECRNAVSVN